MARIPEQLLSKALFGPVSQSYKTGGFGLAFLTLGAFLMLTAFFRSSRDTFAYIVVGTGFFLIALSCVLFLYKDVLPLFRGDQELAEKREIVDSIQTTALEMTELASELEALAFKHASSVSNLLGEVRPMLRSIPLFGAIADSPAVVRADGLSALIVDYTVKAKAIISSVEDGLVRSDPAVLKVLIEEIRVLRADVSGVLRA